MRRASLAAALLTAAGAAGAQTPAGPEFRVNTYTTETQDKASASIEPDGDFVVTWRSYGQDGDHFGVFGQRFAASGARRGGEFRANAYTTGRQIHPAVAVGRNGDFVVAWSSEQDGDQGGVVARRFDTSGTPIGGEFLVNQFTTGDQSYPRIARDPRRQFVVAWSSPDLDGSSLGVAARRFDAAGAPLAGELLVNTYTTSVQRWGDVSVAADGSFVTVWEDYTPRDGSGSAIFAQRFDAAGGRAGGEFRVNTYTIGRQALPSVSVSPAGGFVVAWSSQSGDGDGYGIFARRFDAAGAGIGSDFVVNAYTADGQLSGYGSVAHDGRGNFVIVWHGPGDGSWWGIRGQRFDASGGRRGAEFQVNTYTTDIQEWASVVSDAVGNFAVFWEHNDQSPPFATEVQAQRFGGLHPVALAVVDGGNGVLEVPDDFALRTTWRNLGGAPRTFQGQGSEFTGPPGLIYTLGSANADYGTVADGATSTCVTPCLSGALLGVRPPGHVDVSIREKIVPDVLGQDQRWILHVGKTFSDVPPANPFYRFIETLLHRGVTGGCSATAYCPAAATTREQMAIFVLLAREGEGYLPPACGATPMFADVPVTSPFCRWIEELARRGVVGGCGGGNYCPSAPVTREAMAVFVLRMLDPALNPSACGVPMFADVPASSPFCRWVEELARRGIVAGCGGGSYCPSAPVTREQMGVFLGVTFGLTLYGP